MAKARSGKRKSSSGKRGKRKSGFARNLVKTGFGLAILFLVVVAGVIIVHNFIPEPGHEKKPQKKVAQKAIPPFEIFPKGKTVKKALPSKPTLQPTPVPGVPVRPDLPKIAIIIDDMGYDGELAKLFMALDPSLTLSLLPEGPASLEIAERAKHKGFETLLHLPMEPREYPSVKPGPGALLSNMTPDELIFRLEKNLGLLPDIKGVNNHMGSRMTENSAQMNQIFSVLKRRGLFFVDSLTTARSLGESSARLFKIPYEQRDVFIDHIEDRTFIRGQIEQLVRIAESTGTSVGIAHPHEITYEVLAEMLPALKKRVEIVPVSRLVHSPG